MKRKSQVQRWVILAALLLVGMSTACSALPADSANLPVSTSTAAATITPTVVWFPPTATLIPPLTPTPMPAQDLKPGIGQLLFSDAFQTAESWPVGATPAGNIAVSAGKLTLSVQTPKSTLQALRMNPTLDNFYAETTVTANLCQGDDMLGILFRAYSDTSTYRYLIDCNGRVSAQVVIGGAPTFMQDWTTSGELRTGLLNPVKLGLWVSGDVMRFFINDQFQFEATRETLASGGIGFYARAASDSALSVSFSDFSVYQVSSSNIQTLTPHPLSPSATPAP